MNSQNISKLFPTVLKKMLEKCNGNYKDLLADRERQNRPI